MRCAEGGKFAPWTQRLALAVQIAGQGVWSEVVIVMGVGFAWVDVWLEDTVTRVCLGWREKWNVGVPVWGG